MGSEAKQRRRRLTRAESREQNRRALIAAARELMVRDGYRHTMLDEVAKRAGLTKGAIYSIFGSKQGLLRAVVTEGWPAAVDWPELDSVTDPSLSLEGQLRRFAERWMETVTRGAPVREHAFTLEVGSLTLTDRELFEAQAATMAARIDELAQAFTGRRTPAGATTTRPAAEALASAFAGLMQGLSQRALYHPLEFAQRLFPDAAAALARLPDDHY